VNCGGVRAEGRNKDRGEGLCFVYIFFKLLCFFVFFVFVKKRVFLNYFLCFLKLGNFLFIFFFIVFYFVVCFVFVFF